jgi:hypothetical protein
MGYRFAAACPIKPMQTGADKLPHICQDPERSAETGEDHIREGFMRTVIAGLFVASTLAAGTANAQYGPFNEVGVTRP